MLMFDFERLEVYQKIKQVNLRVLKLLRSPKNIDGYLSDQWRRATLSVALNLAEGTGRVSNADKKRFYTIARSSVFECVAILDIVSAMEDLSKEDEEWLYISYEQVSKMLLALYRSFDK